VTHYARAVVERII